MNESQQPVNELNDAFSGGLQPETDAETLSTPVDTLEGAAVTDESAAVFTPPTTEAAPLSSVAEQQTPVDENAAIDSILGWQSEAETPDERGTQSEMNASDTAPLSKPTASSVSGGLSDVVTRPLPQEAVVELQGLAHLSFAQATDVGRVRANNQDAVFSFFSSGRSNDKISDFGLFIVADGLGGHQDGEKASALSTRTIAQYVLKNLYMPMLQGGLDSDQSINDLIADAVLKAHMEIQSRVPQGSTTCSAVIVIDDIAYIAHVGDSRIYLIHKGKMEQLTRDHSVVQRLIELDHITPDEAAAYQNRNYLYRALGQNEDLEIDTYRRRLLPNSRLLLCSDGLWGQVGEAEILEVLNSTDNLQEACFQLIAMANMRGGADNVSVSIVQLPK
jgi:serine/threonine protein phosphatase PrpC